MEKFLLTFTKKNPSEFLAEQRAKSNEQKVRSNEQKVTSIDQKVTSNEQRVKSFTSKQTYFCTYIFVEISCIYQNQIVFSIRLVRFLDSDWVLSDTKTSLVWYNNPS